MPIKIFAGSADDATMLEAKINEWMAKLEPGAVRQVGSHVGSAMSQGSPQIVVTVWYTEGKDRN